MTLDSNYREALLKRIANAERVLYEDWDGTADLTGEDSEETAEVYDALQLMQELRRLIQSAD